MSVHEPSQHLPVGGDQLQHPTAILAAEGRDQLRLELFRHWLQPGDLVFDIGANIGEVTSVMLALGCRVVAVEPQEDIARQIDSRAEVVVAACGSSAGEMTQFQFEMAPYLSTLRPDLAASATGTNNAWTPVERTVPVVTLDSLVERFGVPAFAKIDVEGFEAEVLRGLHHPIPRMSLEVHNFDTQKVGDVCDQLERLGDYGLTYSRGESYRLEMWPPRELAFFGDIYAALR